MVPNHIHTVHLLMPAIPNMLVPRTLANGHSKVVGETGVVVASVDTATHRHSRML